MKVLKVHYHPDVLELGGSTVFTRLATRAIATHGDRILLLYTDRYEDYSLPGGGIDEDEGIEQGMMRELIEETGARNITNIEPFGIYEEYRPWHKSDFEVQHMISYCFTCNIDHKLGVSNLESYEIKNGMKPQWVDIYEAIAHNERTMAGSVKKGMSIERETYLLKLIAEKMNVGAD